MKQLIDYQGRIVRLTRERERQILEHLVDDAFVLTAYLTDQPKSGEVLWPTS